MTEEIRTTCTRDCPNACGLIAVVENGKVVQLKGDKDHPVVRGYACGKTSAFVKRMYSPERVLSPLLKKDGAWVPISWDEALDRFAEALKSAVAAHGPESILLYQGFAERTAKKLLNGLFFNLLGGVTGVSGTLCGGTGYAALSLDVGERLSHNPSDHAHAKTIILWGRNPAATQFGLLPILEKARKGGAVVVLIDPARTESVRLADRVIAPKPGSDAFLALAVAKVILKNGWEDRDFLVNHCDNGSAYKAMLDSFELADLSSRADVPLARIEELAGLIAKNRPCAILLGWGLHRWVDAHLTLRAINALGAITGNLGVSGGGVSQGFEEWGPYDLALVGDEDRPKRRSLRMPLIGEDILAATNPPIDVIVNIMGNPVAMAPDSATVAKAYAKTPFVVVIDQFLTDTADHAELFLPGTTFLEDEDVVASFGHPYVGPVNRAVHPLGQTRPQHEIFLDLSKRFPFHERFAELYACWPERIVAPLAKLGHSPRDLQAGPVHCGQPDVPFAGGTFLTPNGKFQLLPAFDPAFVQDEAERRAYPLALLSISPKEWLCSETTLAEGDGPLPCVVNAAHAEALGFAEGEEALVQSPVGELRIRLKLDPETRADLCLIRRGGWIKAGRGVNLLTKALVSTLGGGTAYYQTRVRLAKIDG